MNEKTYTYEIRTNSHEYNVSSRAGSRKSWYTTELAARKGLWNMVSCMADEVVSWKLLHLNSVIEEGGTPVKYTATITNVTGYPDGARQVTVREYDPELLDLTIKKCLRQNHWSVLDCTVFYYQ